MHCQNCGQKLRSKARFCNGCGKSVVERFGSALLTTQSVAAGAPDTPTENLSPKTRTAPNKAAPSTLESQTMPATDQLGLRGTGRQPVAKHTFEEPAPKLSPPELRTTVVEAKAFKELAPTRPVESGSAAKLADATVEAKAFVPPPALANLGASPKVAVPAPPPAPAVISEAAPDASLPDASLPDASLPDASLNASIEFIAPSTQELQSALANKPFFTRMLTPNAANAQHKYLLYAVPLVLLAAFIVFIFFLWLR
jgi:hypothetical protein